MEPEKQQIRLRFMRDDECDHCHSCGITDTEYAALLAAHAERDALVARVEALEKALRDAPGSIREAKGTVIIVDNPHGCDADQTKMKRYDSWLRKRAAALSREPEVTP